MTFRTMLFAAVSVTAFGSRGVHAQDADEMVVRVYPVANLVRSVPDYPYEPGLPTSRHDQPTASGTSQQPGGGGFGGGGLGGGGGGGFFQIGGGVAGAPGNVPRQQSVDLEGLANVIQRSIAPATWNIMGGDGTIVALGTTLVVRQTVDVHKEIQTLLDALSQTNDRQTMVTIRAFLITLDRGTTLRTDKAIPVDYLRQAADEMGEITCFSGQQVHLASGHRRNVVTSQIPVVSAFSVGYQPVTNSLHIGSLLEFTSTVDPGGKTATLDVRCTITEWKESGEPIKFISEFGPGKTPETPARGFGGSPSAGFQSGGGRVETEIDRVNLDARQLATTVRVPVSAEGEPPIPVVVGTLGQPKPTADEKDEASGLTYLVVAVSRQ